ncbi:hypothetical protein H0H93_014905 [Arthromyces matolae]|nr:hypothetical protein H0H93_014905 [Arthromyces matolae]
MPKPSSNTASGGPTNNSPSARNPSSDVLQDTGNVQDLAAQLADLQAKLAESQAANTKLQEELNATPAKTSIDKRSATIKMIPRPTGTAGHQFSIQEEMGLVGSAKKMGEYKALVLSLGSPFLLRQCQKEHPILARFVNDWATEEIIKQYLKNKRTYAYKKGYLDRPSGYEHLKVNASKRSNAPRRKKASRIIDNDAEEEPLDEDENNGGNSGGERDEDDDSMGDEEEEE